MKFLAFICGTGVRLSLTAIATGVRAGVQAPQRYDHGDPGIHEQLMLVLLNRARTNPSAEASRFNLSNLNNGLAAGTISTLPKPPLAFHPNLIRAARDHTQWMLDEKKFQHEGPDPPRADGHARMATAGYYFSGAWRWGENISWGAPGGAVDVTALTNDAHRRLFLSAGHRVNICDPAFDDAGVGIQTGNYQSMNGVMVTQDFAVSASSPGPLLVGVVFADADNDAFYDPGEGVSGVSVQPVDGSWCAVTSRSGGYAVPYPPGSTPLTVTFSGSILRRTLTRTVSRTGVNVTLDLNPGQEIETATHFVSGSLTMSAAGEFLAEVTGLPGAVFTVEHSVDLRVWTGAGRFTMDRHTMPFLHRPAATGHGYYRLRR